jgi:hypothetical protein
MFNDSTGVRPLTTDDARRLVFSPVFRGKPKHSLGLPVITIKIVYMDKPEIN